MKTTHPYKVTPSLLLAVPLVCWPILLAESPDAANSTDAEASTAGAPLVSSAGAELNWLRIHTNNNVILAIYQPQIEKWEGEDLESRSAAAITPAGATASTYGVFWLHARADVDKTAGIVTLNDIQVTRATFPTEREKEAEYLALIRSHVPTVVQNMALDHLEASYAISPPHYHLGEVFVNVSGEPSKERIENAIRKQAAKLGADAAVIVYDRTHLFPVVYVDWWGATVSHDRQRDIVAVAIHYKDEQPVGSVPK
jgi:hypothetical protein